MPLLPVAFHCGFYDQKGNDDDKEEKDVDEYYRDDDDDDYSDGDGAAAADDDDGANDNGTAAWSVEVLMAALPLLSACYLPLRLLQAERQ